jgi:hypothetical protein
VALLDGVLQRKEETVGRHPNRHGRPTHKVSEEFDLRVDFFVVVVIALQKAVAGHGGHGEGHIPLVRRRFPNGLRTLLHEEWSRLGHGSDRFAQLDVI